MNPRLRRLQADYKRITDAFERHPYIHLAGVEGNPPEKYIIEFKLDGLVADADSNILRSTSHRAEVFLPKGYPRRPPFCRMTTPVFHPNIDPQKICIGDHWSAGESLANLIIRIGEMICFQSYNVKSPLNGKAAAWAEKHLTDLPLLKADIGTGV